LDTRNAGDSASGGGGALTQVVKEGSVADAGLAADYEGAALALAGCLENLVERLAFGAAAEHFDTRRLVIPPSRPAELGDVRWR
jgi:hypothetical protein